MRKLLNTLYVTSEKAYLSLDGENIVVHMDSVEKRQFPLHTLETVISFSYKGASPSLMGKCAQMGIHLSFYTPRGRYLASVIGQKNGNVLLRRQQYRIADQQDKALKYAKGFILGKLYNSRYLLKKYSRDHPMRVDVEAIEYVVERLKECMWKASEAISEEELRGLEGRAAGDYFSVFDNLILQNRSAFHFWKRSRRPPLDRTNALLSFAYSLLANDCASALYSVGFDPYVGFLHKDRPGRVSLALDLMEELRAVYADRFVLTLINNRIVNGADFDEQESGAVQLTDEGRKRFLSEWQKKKKVLITHPYLKEKMPWGLVPFIQSQLLARTIRGDLEMYPPFFWK